MLGRYRITSWMALADFFVGLAVISFALYASVRIRLTSQIEDTDALRQQLAQADDALQTFHDRLYRARPDIADKRVAQTVSLSDMTALLSADTVLLEYVTLNIPVVVPRLPTVQYYFSDEMVSYFEPEDSDALAVSILALYQNSEKRERQAHSARKFLDQFGWEIHQKDFLDLYSRL